LIKLIGVAGCFCFGGERFEALRYSRLVRGGYLKSREAKHEKRTEDDSGKIAPCDWAGYHDSSLNKNWLRCRSQR
jgi:hypothetical protein